MNTSTIIKAAELFVRNRLNDESTGHDWWHIERVRATGRHLQKSEGGDSFIIDLSLLLHDVGDRKVIHQEEDDYTIATSFLTQQGVDTETTRTIIQIISHMSFSNSLDPENTAPTSIEFQSFKTQTGLTQLGRLVSRAHSHLVEVEADSSTIQNTPPAYTQTVQVTYNQPAPPCTTSTKNCFCSKIHSIHPQHSV